MKSRLIKALAVLPSDFLRRRIVLWAVENEDQDLVDRLLPSLASERITDWHGFPLEFVAARQDNLMVLEELLKQRQDLDIRARFLGQTLLHAAASGGGLACCQFLLEKGADANAKNRGETPLHDAATASLEVCELLLNAGSELDCGAGEAGTALSRAGRNPEIAEFLLAQGANPEAADLAGKTPLMNAWHPKTVQLLLDADVDVHRIDDSGRDALSYAAQQGDDIIPILVAAGAEIRRRDTKGLSPLGYAMCGNFQEYPEAVAALLAHGADVEEVLMQPDLTPLAVACLHAQLPVIPIVLEAGAEINARSPSGKTVLQRVRESRREAPGYFKAKLSKVEKILLAAGAD